IREAARTTAEQKAVAAQIATAIATAARMTGAAAGHVIQTAGAGTRANVATMTAAVVIRGSAGTTTVGAGTRASVAMTTVVGDAGAVTTIAAPRARPTPANTHASSAPAAPASRNPRSPKASRAANSTRRSSASCGPWTRR